MPSRNLAPAQTLPWRSWFSLQRWRTRAKYQLSIAPLCACQKQGRITPGELEISVFGQDFLVYLVEHRMLETKPW
jgi:hypothetical protein